MTDPVERLEGKIRQYGDTGCQVFKRGVQNWKDFCLNINVQKGKF